MNVVVKSAKFKEEALELVLKELNASEEEVVYSFKEVKGGLFKGVTYECRGFLKTDILTELQEYLKGIITGMGLEVSFEVNTKDGVTTIKMYTSKNPIIIGHNGQNLDALTTIARQFIKNITSNGPKILLDVEDYKDRQVKRLERLAKNLARDVIKTKTDVEMDNMNSYERRVVHNALSDFKGVKTESVGEEPNRHVVIKYDK